MCVAAAAAGVLVALTNIRSKTLRSPAHAVSRGALVMNILEGGTNGAPSFAAIAEAVAAAGAGAGAAAAAARVELGADYAPFNMLVARLQAGSPPEAYYMSQNELVREADAGSAASASAEEGRSDAPLAQQQAWARRVGPGVHGFSNSDFNDDSWVKVHWVRRQLEASIAGWPSLSELRMRLSGMHGAASTTTGSASDMGDSFTVAPGTHQLSGVGGGSTSVEQLLDAARVGVAGSAAAAAAAAPGGHGHTQAAVHHDSRPYLREHASAVAHKPELDAAAEQALLEEVLRELTRVMTRAEPLTLPEDEAEAQAGQGGEVTSSRFPWSPLPEALEQRLQEHVFIPPAAGYGTRSLSIVIQIRHSVYYCYRSFDPLDTTSTAAPAVTAAAAHARSNLARAVVGDADRAQPRVGAQEARVHGDEAAADADAVAAAARSLAASSSSSAHSGTDAGVGVAMVAVPEPGSAAPAASTSAPASLRVADVEWTIVRVPAPSRSAQ